jgi:hypothetical protein
MAATIFSGAYVKALRAGLNLFNEATIWSGHIDPSVSGFAAPVGDVYISTSTYLIYSKVGGADINWAAYSAGATAGANTFLSNLTSPTALNQDLIFSEGMDASIKTADDPSASFGLNVRTGDGTTGNATSGNILVASGAAVGTGGSGSVSIESGTSVDGATGSINIVTPGPSGTGTSGGITIASGNPANSSSGGVNLFSGSVTGTNTSGPASVATGSGADGGSGEISITTGDVVTTGAASNTGDILLHVGSVFGPGPASRGNIKLQNGSEGTAGQVWTSTDTTGSGSWAAAPVVVPASSYQDTSGHAISNAGAAWNPTTLIFDDNSLYNTGTGVYTVPVNGYYLVQAAIRTVSTLYSIDNHLILYAYQTGSVSRGIALFRNDAQATGTYERGGNGSVILKCVAGDIISFAIYSDASTTLGTTTQENYFSISKL